MQPQIKYGIDQLIEHPASWRSKNLAFVTNDAASATSGISSRVALLKSGYNILKLFSPEHGINIKGEDGAMQYNCMDLITGLPVISLYGEKLAPLAADLEGIDILLFDIPDIGCRYYTYLWTMTEVMEACALHQKEMIILDRPNPIGGLLCNAEGPMLDPSCASFIGRWNIPLKHACTLGELSLYFNASRKLSLALQVIPVQHYQRSFNVLQDFNFVPTSPAIKTVSSAFFYPGIGLLEGLNINEGRGSANPFTIFGAPWLKADEVLEFLLPAAVGFTATTTLYTPTAGLYAGDLCSGINLTLHEPSKLPSVQTGINIIKALLQVHPQQVQERLYPTVANPSGKGHLDKLLGIPGAFQQLQQGKKINTALNGSWEQMISKYLLY